MLDVKLTRQLGRYPGSREGEGRGGQGRAEQQVKRGYRCMCVPRAQRGCLFHGPGVSVSVSYLQRPGRDVWYHDRWFWRDAVFLADAGRWSVPYNDVRIFRRVELSLFVPEDIVWVIGWWVGRFGFLIEDVRFPLEHVESYFSHQLCNLPVRSRVLQRPSLCPAASFT